MRWLIVIYMTCSICMGLCGQETKTFSFSEVTAKDAVYDGHSIQLTGDVAIEHHFGILRCAKAVVFFKPSIDQCSKSLLPERIVLEGSVHAELKNGNILDADQAEINCITLEGIFKATEPHKVVYVAFMGDGESKIPIKTSSQAITLKMKKESTNSEYIVSEMKGEGAVSIEYQTQEKSKG